MAASDGDGQFRWIGGALCLDFNNTVDWTGLEPTEGELLPTYEHLVDWGRAAGLLSAADARELRSAANDHPRVATGVHRDALVLRRTIHGVFYPLAEDDEPVRKYLQELNARLETEPALIHFDPKAGAFSWDWSGSNNDLARLLPAIAWSAAQLLTSDELSRVKACANERCGWLFVDRSRKHNRRWCQMEVCGNRAKVRRFHQRKKKARGR